MKDHLGKPGESPLIPTVTMTDYAKELEVLNLLTPLGIVFLLTSSGWEIRGRKVRFPYIICSLVKYLPTRLLPTTQVQGGVDLVGGKLTS